jgi:type I restriction enzyme S subunit
MRLPESWVEVPIEIIADVSGGGTPDRANHTYFGGEIPWATPTDVTRLSGYYLTDTKETITETGLKYSSAKLLPAGAVLLTSRATIGKTAIAKVPMSTNQGFVNLDCQSKLIVNEYLARLLESRASYLESRAGGSTFKEISRSTVAKIKVPLPTLPEQQRIVDVLRQAESLSKYRSDTRATIDTATREYCVKLFGDVFTNNKSWPVAKLGKVSDIVRGSSPRPQGDSRLYGGLV